jgi:glycosyltransferase involved in cell wall biosynthesis
VDDGSTDNTREVVEAICKMDGRVKYLYQENAERSAARNNGINHSTGQWICFLDSDDYFLEHHLKEFKQLIDSMNIQQGMIISEAFHEIECKKKRIEVYPENCSNYLLYFMKKSIITPIMVCISRNILIENQFIELFKLSYWEDTHLWLRVMAQYPFFFTRQATAVIVEHGSRSIQTSKKLKKERVEDHIEMIRELERNYGSMLNNWITQKDFQDYISQKYELFLYYTRMTGQFGLYFYILRRAFVNQFSIVFVLYLIKLPLYFLQSFFSTHAK